MKRLLIVAPYPFGRAPSQRFRFEQYLNHLHQQGIETKVASFWSDRHWPAIYRKGGLVLKVYATIEGMVRRLFLLFSLGLYDKVLVHREATPIGPPWWEWAAARIWRKHLIFDFDDAIWLPNNSEANQKLVGKFKAHHKTSRIIGWSQKVMAGNAFLARYASQYCSDVQVVPTTIDTAYHHNRSKRQQSGRLPVVGWTGTHSTLKQLIPLFPVLESLQNTVPFNFLLISDLAPDSMPSFVCFRKWTKSCEIDDLLEMDFGIMPLYDTDWERGKCGFKALQYMALGMPTVVSSVGVNTAIVDHGINGFVCGPMPHGEEGASWTTALTTLLVDVHLREKMGAEARLKITSHYSVQAWQEVYTNIFMKQ